MKKYELVAEIFVKYAIAENAWNACRNIAFVEWMGTGDELVKEKTRHPMGHLILNHGCDFETFRCFQRTLRDNDMKRLERRTIKELSMLLNRIDEVIAIYN
jgi:hypothetical protein